ncbi:MAG: hypothetical protein VW739_00800 [Pelagibacteraceae bacterium]
MPTYNFLIKCSDCDGEGEYQTSSGPIYTSKNYVAYVVNTCDNCEDGYIEVEDYYDSYTDLKKDYPDAVDIRYWDGF